MKSSKIKELKQIVNECNFINEDGFDEAIIEIVKDNPRFIKNYKKKFKIIDPIIPDDQKKDYFCSFLFGYIANEVFGNNKQLKNI